MANTKQKYGTQPPPPPSKAISMIAIAGLLLQRISIGRCPEADNQRYTEVSEPAQAILDVVDAINL